MPNPPLFCINCVNYTPANSVPTCADASATLYDVVGGNNTQMTCAQNRSAAGACGPTATNFQQSPAAAARAALGQ